MVFVWTGLDIASTHNYKRICEDLRNKAVKRSFRRYAAIVGANGNVFGVFNRRVAKTYDPHTNRNDHTITATQSV